MKNILTLLLLALPCMAPSGLTNPEQNRETITVNGVSFGMIYVQGGTFNMGCTAEQGGDCYDAERPPQTVNVSSYKMGETEVTQKLWRAVMGSSPSSFKNCDQCPVETVSWDDAQQFIQKLNSATGKSFRLPTEAEWEFAARGGTKSRGYKYAGSNTLDEVAEHAGNNNKSTKPVKGRKPNELGLYDMSGNVWEWCEDDWHSNYQGLPSDGKAWIGSTRGSDRVLRGGSWSVEARDCRSAIRYEFWPSDRGRSHRIPLGASALVGRL